MTNTNPARKRTAVVFAHALLHLLATVVVALLLSIALAGTNTIETFLTVDGGGLVGANLSAIAFHMIISALLWSLCVFSYASSAARERPNQQTNQGNVICIQMAKGISYCM